MSICLILPISLLLTLVLFVGIWLAHVILHDAGIVDIFWGPGFVVLALFNAIASGNLFSYNMIFLIFTIAWGLRLGAHIGLRHFRSHQEDRRYKRMRDNGGTSFWWMSLFKIFSLQAVLLWLIASPQHVAFLLATPSETTSSMAFFVAGIIFFLVGFITETVADLQLSMFKKNPENQGQTYRGGLWAYSRHPNYFGEALLWWGFGLMAFAISGSFLSFFGPAILTFLILKVSGVRLLENHLTGDKQGYEDYCSSTSAFVPWFQTSKKKPQ